MGKCIMGPKAKCIHNREGKCQSEPKPEFIPCLGEVCWNIKTGGDR